MRTWLPKDIYSRRSVFLRLKLKQGLGSPVRTKATEVSQKHRKALIITSNQDFLQLVAVILKHEVYQFLCSKKEEEGFALAKTENPDVIILLVNKAQEDAMRNSPASLNSGRVLLAYSLRAKRGSLR